jgi:hypothetical protein
VDVVKKRVVEKQLVAKGCNFGCKTPATDAPRLYDEIIAGKGEDWKKKVESELREGWQ